ALLSILIYTPSLHDALPIYRTPVCNLCHDTAGRRIRCISYQKPAIGISLVKALAIESVPGNDYVSIVGVERSVPGKNLPVFMSRSEEHTSELQSRGHLVCRL